MQLLQMNKHKRINSFVFVKLEQSINQSISKSINQSKQVHKML